MSFPPLRDVGDYDARATRRLTVSSNSSARLSSSIPESCGGAAALAGSQASNWPLQC